MLWQAYFPHAEIYGIDLADCSWLEEERIQTLVADQSNRADLQSIVAKFGCDLTSLWMMEAIRWNSSKLDLDTDSHT